MHTTKPDFEHAPGLSFRLVVLSLLLGALVFGCAQIRKVTYPKDFVYLERKQVRSQMALLSMHLRHLDDVMRDSATVGSEQQARILAILNQIDESTRKLGGGGVTTNHLVIDEHIDEFRLDLNLAIRDARADPPNYFALGRLSGSCAGCHIYRN